MKGWKEMGGYTSGWMNRWRWMGKKEWIREVWKEEEDIVREKPVKDSCVLPCPCWEWQFESIFKNKSNIGSIVPSPWQVASCHPVSHHHLQNKPNTAYKKRRYGTHIHSSKTGRKSPYHRRHGGAEGSSCARPSQGPALCTTVCTPVTLWNPRFLQTPPPVPRSSGLLLCSKTDDTQKLVELVALYMRIFLASPTWGLFFLSICLFSLSLNISF